MGSLIAGAWGVALITSIFLKNDTLAIVILAGSGYPMWALSEILKA
jgi:hypothetical protein